MKKEKVGIFLGSFNPITIGHLFVANSVMNEGLVDKLLFMVSPQNPAKQHRTDLAPAGYRLNMVKIALEESDFNMAASDFEFVLPKPSYTNTTLTKLREEYPQYEFVIVCGTDLQYKISKWKSADEIVEHHSFIVYDRSHDGENLNPKIHEKSIYLDAPLIDISSTYVRGLIGEGKSVKYIVPDKVIDYINKYELYKNK